MIEVNKEIQTLIDEYNMCGKINTFFYENRECSEEMKKVLDLDRFDRFDFVTRQNQIAYELLSWEKTFENCNIKTPNGVGKILLSEHGIAFRKSDNAKELPAFFIVIDGDIRNYNSHLYTIDELEVARV